MPIRQKIRGVGGGYPCPLRTQNILISMTDGMYSNGGEVKLPGAVQIKSVRKEDA